MCWFVVRLFFILIENFPPEIVNAPSVINATVGSTVIVNFTAQDRNNDTITFSVVNAPEGATNKREGDVFTFTWPVQSSKKVCVTGFIFLDFNHHLFQEAEDKLSVLFLALLKWNQLFIHSPENEKNRAFLLKNWKVIIFVFLDFSTTWLLS